MNEFLQSIISQILMDVDAVKFADTSRHDPYKNFNFEVLITGAQNFARFGFTKVSGLKATTDVIEYREGGDNLTTHKSPGLTRFDPITLERGMSEDNDSWDWFTKTFSMSGLSGQRKEPKFKATMVIRLKDRDGSVVKAWEVREAWISEYEITEFDAMGNGVSIERIVVQHEGIEKIKG